MLGRLGELLQRGIALGAALGEVGVDLGLPLAQHRLAVRAGAGQRMLGLDQGVLLIVDAAGDLHPPVDRVEVGQLAAGAEIEQLAPHRLDLAQHAELL